MIEKGLPLKVCFVTGTYPDIQCGVGFHTFFLAEALALQGCQISVITTASSLISKHLINKENPCLHLTINRWSLFSCFAVKRALEKIDPDIVHIQLPVRISPIYTSILLPLLRLIYRKKPLIVSLHEFSEGSWLSKIRGVFLTLSAPYVIFPNPNDLRLAIRLFPSWRHRFFHVPIGPTLPLQEVMKVEKPWRDRNAIAYLGILYPRKGLETLFYAIAKVIHEIPQVRLHILSSFSENNPYHRYLKNLGQNLGISDNLIWYSNLSSYEIATRLVHCNISCLPYPGGATFRRSTLLEALTAGTVVITTKTALTPEQLVHGENVYLIPPNDPLALSRAILRLYYDDKICDLIRERGYKLAQEFSWVNIALKTLEVYKTIGGYK
jgi:glycosyltransferase involved in cell wall biosynthesis